MSYLKAYDKLIEVDFEPYKLTKTICDAGYFETLDAGAIVRIGETWTNFYGRWTSIYDLEGRCYDIHPYEVEKVTEKLETKETIEELCDEFDIIVPAGIYRIGIYHARYEGWGDFKRAWRDFKEKNGDDYRHYEILGAYGAIWTDRGLIYVAKMNEKGELELLWV